MYQPIPRFVCLLALAAAVLLTACGGGGQAASPTPTAQIAGTVCLSTSRHNDGDTFRCTAAAEVLTVRVAAIDAPETGQSYSEEARQRLQELTPAGAIVNCYARDSYGRSLCRVYTPTGESVQATMLAEGMAWYGAAYASEQTPQEQVEFPLYERAAYAARRGLWQDPSPQAPWECRAIKSAGGTCR